MLKKLRKSSGRVTLVLIGLAALTGCGRDDQRRDVYASRDDCLADWGNKPEDCTPATDANHRSRGYFYGPSYGYSSSGSGSTWRSSGSSSGRSIGSSSIEPRRLRPFGPLFLVELGDAPRGARPARGLAAQGRGAGFLLPLHGRRLLGRARLLPLHRRRGGQARGGYGRAAGALHRGGRARDRPGRLRALRASRRPFHALIERSWNDDEKSLYGRFDLSWDGNGEPRMLEYNADTPTALLEASVVQWYWLQDVFPQGRPVQFDPREADRALEGHARPAARRRASCTSPAMPTSAEDQGNLDYLRDTAIAGRARRAPDRHRRHRLERQALRGPGGKAPSTRSSSSIRGSGWCARSSASTWPIGGMRVIEPRVEDAALEQGDPADALGDVPRAPEPAAGLLRAGQVRHRLREEADLLARRRQRHDQREGRGGRGAGRLRRRGLHLAGLPPAAATSAPTTP